MNRLVLIGNGFDLAHGLKTSYADFINWYKVVRVSSLQGTKTYYSSDPLCAINLKEQQAWSTYIDGFIRANDKLSYDKIFDTIMDMPDEFEVKKTRFFDRIITSIETKGWVDIENEYYELLKDYAFPDSSSSSSTESSIRSLNRQLDYLKNMLCKYLQEASEQRICTFSDIEDAVYAPIKSDDIANAELKHMEDHVEDWYAQGAEALKIRKEIFNISDNEYDSVIDENGNPLCLKFGEDYPLIYRLPSRIMFLNFNYTDTPLMYFKKEVTLYNKIHGDLNKLESVIFGYGDELDDKFIDLKNHKNNDCLKNVKSIRYLETSNYRQMLSFIESAPFQVLIMGHSCGNSDRTLLNTIFEHKNCVSIKPYYYKKDDGTDNYTEMVQNISRNFNDMQLMRARVVPKTQCKPLVQN